MCAFAWIQGNAARWQVEFEHIFLKIVFDVRNCVWTPRLGNDGKNTKNQIFFEYLNGRLALEDGSDRRETLGKRVSDDLEHFIFRPRFFLQKFHQKKFSASKNEKLQIIRNAFSQSFTPIGAILEG